MEMAVEENERKHNRFRANTMKSLLVIVIVLFNNYIFSQARDTLVILQNDIKLKVENIDSYNPRIGYFATEHFINSTTNQFLNGFYKVIIDENNFYTANYENGLKSLSKEPYTNIIKYYNNKILMQIDYYYPIFFSSQKYISIFNYDCKSNLFLKGFIKDCSTNNVLEEIRIYQKIKKKIICWKIIYPDKTVGKIKLNKSELIP